MKKFSILIILLVAYLALVQGMFFFKLEIIIVKFMF